MNEILLLTDQQRETARACAKKLRVFADHLAALDAGIDEILVEVQRLATGEAIDFERACERLSAARRMLDDFDPSMMPVAMGATAVFLETVIKGSQE